METNLINGLQQLFIGKGYNPVVGTIYQQQEKWINWYRGEVNDFHYFSVKTINGTSTGKKKKSLTMGKKVCEDWSSLLWNNRCELKAGTGQDALNKVLGDNNFAFEISNFIEMSMAVGTGVMVEYIADDKTKINFVYGNKIMPLNYENTTITEIAIMQEITKNDKRYVHVQYHTYNDGLYKVEHEVYEVVKNGALGNQAPITVVFSEEEAMEMAHIEVEDEKEYTCYYVEYETTVPHFQIFKPSITNNYDIQSPMGISVLANSVSALEGVDDAYTSLNNEDVNARKRIYVADEGSKTQKVKETIKVNGQDKVVINSLKYFDKDDTIHQTMVLPEEDPLKFFEPTHQGMSFADSVQMHLNVTGFKSGFGKNFYSFKDGAVYVNEKSVTTSNVDLYSNRDNHILRLKKALMRMMYAVLYLEKELNNYNGSLDLEYDVMIDDSMLEDDNEIITRYEKAANNGWIPPYVASAKMLSISLEEAKALYDQKQSDDQAQNEAFISSFEE